MLSQIDTKFSNLEKEIDVLKQQAFEILKQISPEDYPQINSESYKKSQETKKE